MLQVRALFQTEILNFPVNHIRYHVTEYCAVIVTHSTVRGDKLLYGQIPDPFPRCGIGSGHTRLGRVGLGTRLHCMKVADYEGLTYNPAYQPHAHTHLCTQHTHVQRNLMCTQ